MNKVLLYLPLQNVAGLFSRIFPAALFIVAFPLLTYCQFDIKPTPVGPIMDKSIVINKKSAQNFIITKIKTEMGNLADTIHPVKIKITETDTVRNIDWADERSLFLYSQTGKDSSSIFPSFPAFYFNLAGFTCSRDENAIHLKWSADINKNVRWFLIERSKDKKNFYTAGEISLNGKEDIRDFTFSDTTVSGKLVYYYQIKSLLIDGSFMTSDVLPVKRETKELKVLISSGKEKNSLVMLTNQAVRKIEILNNLSQLIYICKEVSMEKTVNIKNFKPGTYALKIYSDNGFVTQSFFKK